MIGKVDKYHGVFGLEFVGQTQSAISFVFAFSLEYFLEP